jgi:uncharacterized protein (TIGR02186 family)
MSRVALALALALALLLPPLAAPAYAQALIADLSSHLVAITTSFAGSQVLLFGAVENEGQGQGDVVVVVRGPEEEVTVRQKARELGVFVNRKAMVFEHVPSFYFVATSIDLDKAVLPSERARAEIGEEYLHVEPAETRDPETTARYRDALIRNKRAEGLYVAAPARVTFLGARLFRVDLHFPSNVPTGTYQVEVFLLRHGAVVGAQTTPLVVGKAGLDADIYEFSQRQAAAYGAIAVLVALFTGWLVGVVFRRI